MDHINVNLTRTIDNSYSIRIGELPIVENLKKVAIITNPKIAGLHLKKLLDRLKAEEIYIITIPDGEKHKNQTTIDFILERLFEHKLDRKSTLIAFGGGVIGDMVGYVASIFQRGIDFIQIPTTLLSMVDSSVGGKTGFNNIFGKNLVGSFYQPKAVYIDPSFLTTLDKRELHAGMAEVIKMAIMFDKNLFDHIESTPYLFDNINSPALIAIIKRCVELKAEVVERDEKETGERMILNYGHTFAHVIENQTLYSHYLHGEAVAIGIVMANILATKLSYLTNTDKERIENVLTQYHLPIVYDKVDVSSEKFYEAFFLDKKSHSGTITFILPNSIGKGKIVSSLEKEKVCDALNTFFTKPLFGTD